MRILCIISSWKCDVFFNKKILKKNLWDCHFSKTQMENKNTLGENWILLITSSFSLLPSFSSAMMLKTQLHLTCLWTPHKFMASFWQPPQVILKAARDIGHSWVTFYSMSSRYGRNNKFVIGKTISWHHGLTAKILMHKSSCSKSNWVMWSGISCTCTNEDIHRTI